VIFVNPDNAREAGLQQGQIVDLTSYHKGEERIAKRFMVAHLTSRDPVRPPTSPKPMSWCRSRQHAHQQKHCHPYRPFASNSRSVRGASVEPGRGGEVVAPPSPRQLMCLTSHRVCSRCDIARFLLAIAA